jgi:hypothetical protein
MHFSLKDDGYRRARGNYSRLLNLYCRACGSLVAVYQKDGPGNLRRIYFDRIYHPKSLSGLEKRPLAKVMTMRCTKCREELGVPYMYKKEKRKAFRLYQDALTKKIRRI